MYPWESITREREYRETLKSNRIKSRELNQKLKIKYEDKLQFKCIADDIWLYCNYLFDNIDEVRHDNSIWANAYNHKYEPLSEEEKKQFYDKLQELYQNHIRGGQTFFIGKKPSAIAGALFYITCVVAGISYVTQRSISEFICVSEPGLRSGTKLLKKHLNI
jgi:hypothetical protein